MRYRFQSGGYAPNPPGARPHRRGNETEARDDVLRVTVVVVGVILVVLAGVAIAKRQLIARGRYQTSLFTGAPQHESFVRQAELYPVARMSASPSPRPFDAGPRLTLPASFVWEGRDVSVPAFLTETDTAALLVLQDGRLVFEEYWLTGGRDVPWLTHSVSKSVVSAAVGLALRDGKIASVDDAISDYVPAFAGSGYDGVRIEDVLQMSSGVRWNEDYTDRNSDINLFGWTMFLGRSYDAFVAGRVRENPPGTRHRYTGMDTMALGMLVAAASGQPLARYLETELWHPLGAEHGAFWTTDDAGVPLALGGFNATARDLAKLGELYRREGDWHGTRILPADWVSASTSAVKPHLVPGKRELSTHEMGYGYQWWLPEGGQGDYSAIGIYNQFVYVSPATRTVIVKLSANRRYAVDGTFQEKETFELFRRIAAEAARIGDGARPAA